MMWFEKKKYPFLRFQSLRFCPTLGIENSETSENFHLLFHLQIFFCFHYIEHEKG